MVLGVYLDWDFRHEIVTSHALSGLICESDKCWIPKQDFAACELIELDVICPGLGPSGVWLAHGKVWLLRYDRRWQARFTTLQHQPLILSCVPRLALPLQEEQHLHGNTHLANTCVCTFFPRPLAARRLVSEGKVFDSFCLEMTACRISLDSWWWSWFFIYFFFPYSPAFPTAPPWTALTCTPTLSPVSSVWSCCICNAVVCLLHSPSPPPSPRLHPTEPGHHENLEAAEELCLSDLRSPRLVPVHGGRECWQHGSQHTGGWAGDTQLLLKCISHWLVFIYCRFWGTVLWSERFSFMSHQDTCSVSSSVYSGVPLLYF